MSKLVKTMLTSLVIILLFGAVIFVVIYNQKDKEITNIDEQSINKVIEYSYETNEITTDLSDGSFVRIQFRILTDSKRARDELSMRDFQLKNILIKELAIMDEEDFKSGLSELEKKVSSKLNEVMTKGKVIGVYTTNKILQ